MKKYILAILVLVTAFSFTQRALANDGTYVFDVEHARKVLLTNSPKMEQMPKEIFDQMFDKVFSSLVGFTIKIKGSELVANFSEDVTVGTLKEIKKTIDATTYLATPLNPKPDQKPAQITIKGNTLLFEYAEDSLHKEKAMRFIKQ